MNEQSQAKSPEALRAMVAGTLANFQHPTLKHNLTTLKALHHVAWMDDTLHVELVMPFVWHSAFEELKEQCSAELLRITGAKAIDWKLSHNIATLKRVKNQPGINGVKKNCIPLTDGVECGNCARHCPSGAIQMVPSNPEDENSVKIPVVNEERCIGCGACENLCPARPFSAIYVEGHERHRII